MPWSESSHPFRVKTKHKLANAAIQLDGDRTIAAFARVQATSAILPLVSVSSSPRVLGERGYIRYRWTRRIPGRNAAEVLCRQSTDVGLRSSCNGIEVSLRNGWGSTGMGTRRHRPRRGPQPTPSPGRTPGPDKSP